jgi:hypothetical protein
MSESKKGKTRFYLISGLLLIACLWAYSAMAQTPDSDTSERDTTPEGRIDSVDRTNPDTLVMSEVVDEPLYYVTNVLNSASRRIGTAIMCTNVDPSLSTHVEVRLYNWDGVLVDAGSMIIEPLNTATFETTWIDFYVADVAMNSGDIIQGYGLILSEHSNLICSAQILDADNNPPLWMESIPVYGRTGFCSFMPLLLR